MIARKSVHHVTKEEAATDYFQGIIGHYNKCLADNFGQGNHYASDLDGLEGFTNDDAPNPWETYKEAYNVPNAMLDVYDYVNSDKDA